MTELYDENYWSSQFDVTQEDRMGIADHLARADRPQELHELALDLLRARLKEKADHAGQQAEDILLEHGERILNLLDAALQSDPQRFENVGTSEYPQWKARLPEFGQAEVIQYAYDPQTYEVLCRPGQRLSEKRAKRLQELDLYRQVVRFAK